MYENEIFAEPYKIKMVEKIRKITRTEREALAREAGYNVFNLKSRDVYIDLLTDSGTGAMSDEQWSEMLKGDEAYAGSGSFEKLQKAIDDIMGFKYVLPTHQGRGAENVLFSVMVKKDDVVIGNMHFDTTKAHIEVRGAHAINCVTEEAFDPDSDYPFKGNMDTEKLEKLIKEYGPEKIPLVMITVTCNSGGGQPVSMDNIRKTAAILKKYNIPLFFDAARFAENAYFIRTREDAYKNVPIIQIVREMFSYANGATMSCKKDAIVNIGGFIALNSPDLYQQCTQYCVIYEGFVTYGGLSGRDLAAIAQGLYDGIDYEYLKSRIYQTEYLGKKLRAAGIPIIWPIGGHAVYVNARAFLDHISKTEFPAQALVVHLYIEGGVRAVEIGTVLADRDPVTGENRYPEFELVRLAIPRRTYTLSHMDVVVDAFEKVKKVKDKIRGLRFTYEPKVLRHFTARFEYV